MANTYLLIVERYGCTITIVGTRKLKARRRRGVNGIGTEPFETHENLVDTLR